MIRNFLFLSLMFERAHGWTGLLVEPHPTQFFKVANSQKDPVNIPKYFKVCKEAYILFLEVFPWAKLSPTIHRGLAHSWEFIQANGGYGLGGN